MAGPDCTDFFGLFPDCFEAVLLGPTLDQTIEPISPIQLVSGSFLLLRLAADLTSSSADAATVDISLG